MNKRLEALRKKAQSHPFYKLNVTERIKLVSEEIENYQDEKAPYGYRKEALLDMRGERW